MTLGNRPIVTGRHRRIGLFETLARPSLVMRVIERTLWVGRRQLCYDGASIPPGHKVCGLSLAESPPGSDIEDVYHIEIK